MRRALLWLRGSWLLLLLWTIDVVLLVAVIADVFLPVATNASDTTKRLREAALPLFGSGLFGLFVFTLQTTRGRLERRHEVLRSAYKLLLGAVQTVLDLQRELKWYPKGRPSSPPDAKEVVLGNFDRASQLDDEWRRLYREGERDLILEEGAEGPTFTAWKSVRDTYWEWSTALFSGDDAAKLTTLENALNANAKAFGTRCHEALRRLG